MKIRALINTYLNLIKVTLALNIRKFEILILFLDLAVFIFLDFIDFLIILIVPINLPSISLPIPSLAFYELLRINRLLLSIKVNKTTILLKL